MNKNDGTVEVSYQIISDTMDIVTVAFFIDNKLWHIVAGKSDDIIPKLNKLFD